jgi:[acyl-carrier-protein] S-malonyltransferase
VFDRAEAQWPGVLTLCFEGPAEELERTVNTQPCLFAVESATAAALEEAGLTADGAAGFSLGEIAAVCYAGLLDFDAAFALILERARLMQRGAEEHPGAMFAVLRLDADTVERLCASVPGAYPVNYNAPGQIVAACAADSADALKRAAADAGGRVIRLAVGGAFHSPFMDGAARALAERLARTTFAKGRIPVYANRTGLPYGDDPANLLSEQVNHPVRWQDTVQNMLADGYDAFVEVGPGKVLAGLAAKIAPETWTQITDNG